MQDKEFKSIVDKFSKGRLLFSTGYSEGAFLSFWMDKMSKSTSCVQNMDGFKIVKLAGLEGPYNLKDVVKPFLMQDVSPFSSFRTLTVTETNVAKPSLLIKCCIAFCLFYIDCY